MFLIHLLQEKLSLSTVKCSAFEWVARLWRDRIALLLVVLAGLGTAHILVRTATYGAGVGVAGGPFFFSTAMNFLAGEGWRDLTGGPMIGWPPLFPLLLAAFGWVGIDPLTAGRWVNAAAFGLTILAAGCWLRSNLRARGLALVTTAIFVASLPLSHWASRLMTEPLFVLFTLLALMQLAAFLNRKTAAPLWWAAVFTALAAITRYPGVVLIGVGVLVLLVRCPVPLAARLKDAVVFGAVSSLPLAGVLTHNWAVSGTLTGRREMSGQPLSNGLSQVADVFREWVVPPNAPDGLGYLLWMAAGLVLAVGGWSFCSAWVGRTKEAEITKRTASPLFGLGPALPFGVFAAAYLVFIVAVVPFTVRQIIDSRYLLPVYVPLLLVAVFLLDRFLSIKAAGWMRAVRYGLAALVGLGALAHIGFSARENLRITAKAYVAGHKLITQTHVAGYRYWSYTTARWQQSETLNYIRDNHIEGRIYTNRRNLAWLADRTAPGDKLGKYRKIPRKTGGAEIEAGAHILWFDKFYNRSGFGYDDLDFRLLPGIEIVAELADGTVFRRTTAEPFDAEKHRARKQRYANQLIQQADEHVVRAGWTVYRTGRKLIYFKEPCAPADVQAKFILHVIPTDLADLPAHRQRFGSDNLDFYLGDQCIAVAQLPAYAIDRIHIGQWVAEEDRTLWEAEFPAGR